MWDFPKKYAHLNITVDFYTLLSTVKYNSVDVTLGTMEYKYQELDKQAIKKALEETPNFLLKTIIPHVNSKDVIKYHIKDITVKSALSDPVDL
ncbi:MAG: acetoacetate decarboxylase family protein [Francisella endosymbiont of Hyalomma asiaticum]